MSERDWQAKGEKISKLCLLSSQQPVGFGLAGHSAALTPDGRLVIVGGVNSDLHISAATLLYHTSNTTWEVLPTRTLDIPGQQHTLSIIMCTYEAISNNYRN